MEVLALVKSAFGPRERQACIPERTGRKTADRIPPIPQRLRDAVSLSFDEENQCVRLYALNSCKSDMFLHSYTEGLKRRGWKHELSFRSGDEIRELKHDEERDSDSEEYESGIIDILKAIFLDAAKLGASDIHFDATDRIGFLRVRFRVDGRLTNHRDYLLKEAPSFFRILYGVMAEENDSDYWRHMDQAGQIQASNFLPDCIGSMRLQRGPQAGGEFAVLRLFPKEARKAVKFDDITPGRRFSAGVTAFTEYGYTEEQAIILTRAARTVGRATLFSGSTGSGKSTALKIALEYQGKIYPDKSIFTIEDPVEYEIQGARQFTVALREEETRTEAWLRMFRVAMRSDPDIIMVGELRDKATAQTAFEAVLSGHQLWATVHAETAFAALTRLVSDFELPRHDLFDGNLLVAIVNQKLVPALCPQCSIPWRDAGDFLDEEIGQVLDGWRSEGAPTDRIRVRDPRGCNACRFEGTMGRRLVAEVVPITNDLTAGLTENFHQTMREYYADPRHFTKISHALQKILAGEVDPGTVLSEVGELPQRITDRLPLIMR